MRGCQALALVRALHLLKTVLPFDAGVWGTANAAPQGVDFQILHIHQKSPEMMAEYDAFKHRDTAAATLFGRPQATGNFHSKTWFSADTEHDMRDYLRRWNQENILLTSTNNPSTRFMHWMSLYRADSHHHCTQDDRLLPDMLAPHLMQALGMNRVVHLQCLGPSQITDLPRRAAIADLRGELYHCEPQCAALPRTEWNGWEGSTLAPSLLKQMRAGVSPCVGRSVVVSHQLEHALLFITARRRCNADALSARERAVAELVAKGLTHKQVAQMSGRAPSTVRNQIQSIYEKLRVNGVAGLIAERFDRPSKVRQLLLPQTIVQLRY